MAFYFINYDAERFGQMKERITFLSEAVLIQDQPTLIKELGQNPDSAFFLPYGGEADKYASVIRAMGDGARIFYVMQAVSPKDLKQHQQSPQGGDAYIHISIDETMLAEMMESFFPKASKAKELEAPQNKLEDESAAQLPDEFSDLSTLEQVKAHSLSQEMDELFQANKKVKKTSLQTLKVSADSHSETPSLPEVPMEEFVLPDFEEENVEVPAIGEDMSENDKDLSLEELGDLELGDSGDVALVESAGDLDLALSSESESLELGDSSFELENNDSEEVLEDDSLEELSLDDDLGEADEDLQFGEEEDADEEAEDDDLSLGTPGEDQIENLGELDFSLDDAGADVSLSTETEPPATEESLEDGLSLSEFETPQLGDDLSLDSEEELSLDGDLSDDVQQKLQEIDALMELDASQVNINVGLTLPQDEIEDDLGFEAMPSEEAPHDIVLKEEDLNEPLVSEDLNLDSLDFGAEDSDEEEVVEEKPKKKKKEKEIVREARDDGHDYGKDLKEISGAYSGEMERTQATIANLRADRDDLLNRIQNLEEEKLLQNRQTLTMRAELDEKKIELTIVRKKLNEEVNELKDRLKFHDERRLILEEKNRILTQELDKAGQKNKMDVKKVQMRERELEQKLELLKSDAETQIRHRDLKILELKRKLDAMEFDMESISQLEKRSVESRSDLEDKLDKAIKTLRNAITVLEDDTDRGSALEALKKNIDM